MVTNRPPKCTRNPKKHEKVKCNWCNKKPMWGNNFTTHKCIPTRKWMSYTIVGQTSVASMFAPASVQSNEAEQESPEQVEQTEVDDNIGGNDDTTPDPQLTNETKMTDEENRSSSKRSRQPTNKRDEEYRK